MPNQPSTAEDRPGIHGDSKRLLRLHSGRLRRYSLCQLILLKQRPHLADRAVIFQRPGSSGASGGFSKGKRREIWAAEHTSGPRSLSWISERLIILDWRESGIEGWKGWTGAQGKVSVRAAVVRLDTSPLGQMGIRGWTEIIWLTQSNTTVFHCTDGVSRIVDALWTSSRFYSFLSWSAKLKIINKNKALVWTCLINKDDCRRRRCDIISNPN